MVAESSTLPDDGMVTQTTIVPDEWPDLTADEAQEYEDQQIPYPNHATHEKLAQRALVLYQQARSKWTADTADITENWRWLDYLFRANSLRKHGRGAVHVPELLKAHRALVPRVVEAFFGNGQNFFAAKGRDRRDRQRDIAVSSLLAFQLEQNNFRTLMSPYVSSTCKYQVGIWKVVWETVEETIPYHWIDTIVDPKTGETKEVHKRQWKKVCTFVGNRIRMVDPQRLILDAQRWALNDLAYIGDIRDVPLHEVLADHRYENLDLLENTRHANVAATDVRVQPQQAARSGLRRSDTVQDQPPKHTSEFVELGELWCWFNWAPDHKTPDMRKTVITVADGHTVLRLQENPHDDKHLPYAIARYSENGFEFFDVGLYDPAMRVQDEIDHFRSGLYEAVDLQMAPRAFAKGPAADLPNSMFDMPAGWIGKDVGDIVFMPVPNTLASAPFMDQIHRRDIEEITGVTRLWQGTEGGAGGQSTTATEVRRKIEESNRRLLGIIKSIDEGMTKLLQIMHANNQQFMVDKTKFRVLNQKWAKELNTDEYTIRPSELLGPVDFTFYGVTRIQQYGLRGTNLLTMLQVLGPMMQETPQLFNLPNIAKQVYQGVVGEDSEDEILRDAQDIETLQDQRVENQMLRRGQRVAVHPLDDDDVHIRQMDEAGMRDFVLDKSNPEPGRKAALEHYEEHEAQRLKKQAQMRAMRQQARVQQMMRPQPAETEGNEAPAAGGLEQGKRQTPGDGTPQQTARMGRSAPIAERNNGNAA